MIFYLTSNPDSVILCVLGELASFAFIHDTWTHEWSSHFFSIYFLRYVLMPCVMYSFPIATVSNCHKFRDLKQQKSTLSQFWKPEVWNQCHWIKIKLSAGPHSLQRLQVESFPQPQVTASTPWLAATSLQSLLLWAHRLLLSHLYPVSLRLSPIRILVIAFGAHTDIEQSPPLKTLPLITLEKTLFFCKVTFIGSWD